MIEGLSGGINAVSAFVMGTGFNLGTSITNLMRLGVVGAGALGNIGSIVSGVGNTISPTSMLDALGFSSDSSTYGINRGSGLQRTDRNINQVSRSNMLGNSNGQDYVDSITQQAEYDANEKVQVKQNEEQTKSINDIHEYLLQVFDPKITGITRMLGVISGTKVSSGDNN